MTLTAGQRAQRRTAAATLWRALSDAETHDLAEARRLERDLLRPLVGDAGHTRHRVTLTGSPPALR